MNISQLEYLRELIHAGSFTLAAENLGITQPALSTQIRKLEEETDLVLVNRFSKPLSLTDDGDRFYELASEILQKVEVLSDLSSQLSNQVTGNLKIGIIPTLAPYFLPLFMSDFQTRYPDLSLIITESLTEDIVNQLRTGHLDAGVVATPVHSTRMNITPLFYERFYLYVSDRHPLYRKESVTIEELNLEELWYLQEGNCFSNQVDALCQVNSKNYRNQSLTYSSNSIESLRRIVEQAQGITFIPELATIQVPSESEDMIKPVTGVDAAREISLLTAHGFAKKRLLDAFSRVALSQLPPHMKKKPEGWIVDTGISVKASIT